MNKTQIRLVQETYEYWDNQAEGYDRIRKKYIPELLPQELAWARSEGVIEDIPCDVLVLLVGHSMEPLLQVICAFSPEKLLLIPSKYYHEATPNGRPTRTKGRHVAERLESYLPQLEQINPGPDRLPQTVEIHPTSDEPAAIFHILQQKLPALQKGQTGLKPAVIDITGAKKSMVAGAFLYAAYTGTAISYVDFKWYEPKKGRPFGFTCQIKPLQDPYDAFRLRDWERVRQLYQSYQFRAARKLLDNSETTPLYPENGLIQWMGKEDNPFFSTEQVAAAQKLADIVALYELWDNGDFHRAHQALQSIKIDLSGFAAPIAVQKLGHNWPYCNIDATPNLDSASETYRKAFEQNIEQDLPLQIPGFVTYCQDELNKIERLIEYNEDYRSALLRSAGLDESILRAMWVYLWQANQVEVAEETATRNGRPTDQDYTSFENATPHIQAYKATLQKIICSSDRVGALIPGLINRPGRGTFVKDKRIANGKKTIYLRRSNEAPFLIKPLPKEFRYLRNKAIHTYLSVPYDIADAAYLSVNKNFLHFRDTWAKEYHPSLMSEIGSKADHQALLWNDLCQICGVDFLPPPPRKEIT